MTREIEHLDALVGMAALPGAPNAEIAGYVDAQLRAAGARVHRIADASGTKSGLFAALGPEGPGGAMLSGHLDVVPTEGQAWTSDPFRLRRADGRLYGRGTADMKGFLACMLAVAGRAGQRRARPLARPLKLCFSWDEEIGCRGIPVMLERLCDTVGRPAFCVVGEPTGMRIATGHKGKRALRATCRGEAGHSADAPAHVNALHLGADVIALLREEQARLEREGARDPGYATPFSTVHAGVMRGGTALNIVPDMAEILFEIRYLPGDDPGAIVARLRQGAAAIAGARAHGTAARGAIEIEETGDYPGFAADPAGPALGAARALLPGAEEIKVSFGTEAGHFEAAAVPAIVCGPGDMAQGHKADEFVETAQIAACAAFCDRLLDRLSEPG